MDIPRDNNKEDCEQRKEIISQVYRKWTVDHPEKRVYNDSLKGYIHIRYLSITETIRHASKSYESTYAVLSLDKILRNAVMIGKPRPVKKGVKNQKPFSRMIELRCEITGIGIVKMMVGIKRTGEMIQYCITAKRT